jgi:putative FmdB family regulatory protein
MPTYEYRCKDCGEHLEVVQSFTDDALTECPNCGGTLRKVFGNIGITFKGSGFYKTDSRKAASSTSKSSTGDSGTSESSSGDSSSSSSSDTSKPGSVSSDGSSSKSDSTAAKTA